MLPRIISQGRATKLLLTGRLVDGVEAERIGLVDEIVTGASGKEEDDACPILAKALEVAGDFASSSPIATRGMVRTLRMKIDDDGPGLETALRREADQQAVNYARVDWKEGLDAVMQKRAPVFDPFFSA
jgi:enoyl-CoA hydratase/carnithine racemase